MATTTTDAAASESWLTALCAREHARCFACRPRHAGGLGLRFRLQPDGTVCADWVTPAGYESYDGILHGGLIATALDSAMVHALFARNVVARTGELDVRYRQPVTIGCTVSVRAWLTNAYPPLYQLEAEVCQSGAVCAHARAKFMST
ncbi:PaaI family thioesterase [Opitutus sp. ER46]|uniref:PaaI family thioesterase n=1 Tax=Opitutus sp. ER46 TaxID=2161864 RepID=UPI000D325303|nr:PaaI family thioesterase [Opitutus sp. ER46]PTX90805.1 PaaI family thioesterase [Opitutus sp. ER46]